MASATNRSMRGNGSGSKYGATVTAHGRRTGRTGKREGFYERPTKKRLCVLEARKIIAGIAIFAVEYKRWPGRRFREFRTGVVKADRGCERRRHTVGRFGRCAVAPVPADRGGVYKKIRHQRRSRHGQRDDHP